MKKVLLVAGSIILLFGLFMAGCKALIHTIGSSTDCERFNIDGIEVRTGIDIPSITNVDCIYNKGVKDVTFTLDTNKIVVEEYLERNKFIKQDDLYVLKVDSKRTNWLAEYDVTLATLKMHIIYKDVKEES